MLPALQNVAAKAERVLTEIKADIKADFGRPLTLDGITRHSGKHKHGEHTGSADPHVKDIDLRLKFENTLLSLSMMN